MSPAPHRFSRSKFHGLNTSLAVRFGLALVTLGKRDPLQRLAPFETSACVAHSRFGLGTIGPLIVTENEIFFHEENPHVETNRTTRPDVDCSSACIR